jgi:hypothetical protein
MKYIKKLFGGIDMTWKRLLIFSVAAGVIPGILLCIPILEDTSFTDNGATFEWWILFAIIIITNCKKPLEAACKTFVFFIISQPLIYLLQVPFTMFGWGIFMFYKRWFIMTLATFPMAFIGWYITKRNWLSVLIFAPVLAYLGYVAYGCAAGNPTYILAAVFCAIQIIVYVLAFFPGVLQKIAGLAIPVIVAVVLSFTTTHVDLTGEESLPEAPSFSEEAVMLMDWNETFNVQLIDPQTGKVYFHASDYGTTSFAVQDGDTVYHYTLEVYDDNGEDRAKFTFDGTDKE